MPPMGRARRSSNLFALDWDARDETLIARTGQAPASYAIRNSTARVMQQDYTWPNVTNHALRFGYIGTEFGLLCGRGSTNTALGSNLFGDGTYWAGDTGFTITTVPSVIGGQNAYKHTNIGGGTRSRLQVCGVFVNGQTDCFWAIIENVNATETRIGIHDETAGAWVHVCDFWWASHTIVTVGGAGGSGVVDLANGRYLVWLTATGTAAGTGQAGNTRSVYCYPSGGGVNTEAAIIHHAEFNTNCTYPPESPTITVGASATTNAELPSWPPLAMKLQDFTVALQVVIPVRTWSSYDSLLIIGGTSNGVGLWLSNSAAAVHSEILGTPNVESAYAAPYTARSPLRVVAQFKDWGTGPVCRHDVGAGFGAWSAASNARSALGTSLTTLNSGSHDGVGGALYQRFRVAPGLQTLATMTAGW